MVCQESDEWSLSHRPGRLLCERPEVRRSPFSGTPVDGKAKAFDDPSFKDYALEGELTVNGVRAKPAFQLIKERMKEYTPEWAEKITSSPQKPFVLTTREFVDHAMIGSTIVIDGFTFPFRPAQIAGSGRGAVSHKGGMYFDLATKIINMLVGVDGSSREGRQGIETPALVRKPSGPMRTGSSSPSSKPSEFHGSFRLTMSIWRSSIRRSTRPPIWLFGPFSIRKNIISPFPSRRFLICGANPIRAISDREIFIEAFKKVPFIVTVSTQFDETTMMADIVLPESYFLERKFCRFYLVVHQSIADDVRGLEMALCRNPVKPMLQYDADR